MLYNDLKNKMAYVPHGAYHGLNGCVPQTHIESLTLHVIMFGDSVFLGFDTDTFFHYSALYFSIS